MKEIPLLTIDDIEVKVKQVGKNGAVALLYKTARVDMAILDEVFGAMNWTDDFREIKGNLYCGIGIRQDENSPFVWKWDCGTESRADGEGNEKKGEASDSFKRAGFKWGIGRELYTAPFISLKVPTKLDGKKWVLADKYAKFHLSHIKYTADRKISEVEVKDDDGKVVFSTNRKPLNDTPFADKQKDPAPKEEELTPVTFVCDEMANDIYARANKKGFDEMAVNKVILATYNTDNIFDLTTEEGKALIKRIEAAK